MPGRRITAPHSCQNRHLTARAGHAVCEKAALMQIYNLHPVNGKWAIHAGGFPGSLGEFETKNAALEAAGRFLWRQCGALNIYNSAGGIEEERIYTPDGRLI